MEGWFDDGHPIRLWNEVIRRWWDRSVPSDYPATDNEFSLDFGDNKDAVNDMEASLNTEESVVAPYVPENTYIQNYVGVFEVEGEGGDHILISPERVNTDNVIALHYNAAIDGWENIENVVVEDGYVYGDVESLSPIAVFTYRDDICVSTEAIKNVTAVVCNGNPVKVYTDEEDGKVYVINPSSGTKLEIPNSNYAIIGGAASKNIPSASIAVVGVNAPNLTIYAGSCGSDEFRSEIENASVLIKDSTVKAVTGSHFRTRTKNLTITMENSKAPSFIAAGQSWYTAEKKDSNKANPDDTSDFITYNATFNLTNTETQLLFLGGNSGYSYTKNSVANINGGKIDYLIAGGSNGRLDNATMNANGVISLISQTVNRGTVGKAIMKIDNANVEKIFVAGDSTDSTVNGTVSEITYDIGKGVTGELLLGVNGGEELADNSAVHNVKYSRSANLTISDGVKKVLGEKLIVK